MSDQPGDGRPDDPEELERELEELEERIDSSTKPSGVSRSRLRRLNRQVREAAPDALVLDRGRVHGAGYRAAHGQLRVRLDTARRADLGVRALRQQRTLGDAPCPRGVLLTILIAMHTSFVREGWLVAVIVVDSALLLLGIAGYISDNTGLRVLSNGGYGFMLLATALVVLRRVLTHQTVTSRTLSGAVAALFFVGLAFASFAEASVLHDPASYSASGGGSLGFATMLYFSFVTLPTLGYGDIVPVSSTARSLATMEAVLGQIYLVTIVARLVSLLGMGRLDSPADAATSDDQSQ